MNGYANFYENYDLSTRARRDATREAFSTLLPRNADNAEALQLRAALMGALDELDRRDEAEEARFLAIREGVDAKGKPYKISITVCDEDGTPNAERSRDAAEQMQAGIQSAQSGAAP